MKRFPNNLRYKKYHKVNFSFIYLLERKSFYPFFGDFALQSLESGKLTFAQIEACRKTIKKRIRNSGFLWIRVFTWVPVTKKPVGVRMGKGKGNISYWISPIKKGQIIFEIYGLDFFQSVSVLKKALSKLPVKVKIVKLKY